MRRAALLAGLLLLVAGCGGDADESAATATSATSTSEQTTTAGPKLDSRCIEGTSVITRAIDSGLRRKRWTLTRVYAVKTTAYGSVFFVSGQIDGVPKSPIATWATNNLNLGGLIFSVDPVAKEHSKWAKASTFDSKLTMRLDGARQSRACVKESEG